jgi:hypothetical protein
MGGEEVDQCGVVHGGIPEDGDTCPLGGEAHGISDGR